MGRHGIRWGRAVAAGGTAVALAVGAVGAGALAGAAQPARAHEKSLPTVTLALSDSVYTYLPVWLAHDRGYFRKEGVNVVIKPYTGSSVVQVPILANGGEDLLLSATVPAEYSAVQEGLPVTEISSLSEAHSGGYSLGNIVLVSTKLWKKGIHNVSQAKGLHYDLGFKYSPVWMTAIADLQQAHVSPSSVEITYNLTTPAQDIPALEGGQADVVAAPQPIAESIIAAGAGKQFGSDTSLPWFQNGGVLANTSWYDSHRNVAKRFLMGLIKGLQVMEKAGPHWTPSLVKTTAKWSGFNAKTIRSIPALPYFGQLGAISRLNFIKQGNIFRRFGAFKGKVDISKLYDGRALRAARKALGIKGPAVFSKPQQ